MVGGFEVSFYEAKRFHGICGVIPRENDEVNWFLGLKILGVPLLGDFAQIFKRLDPAVVFVDGKAKFGIMFEFREEEVKKRMQD